MADQRRDCSEVIPIHTRSSLLNITGLVQFRDPRLSSLMLLRWPRCALDDPRQLRNRSVKLFLRLTPDLLPPQPQQAFALEGQILLAREACRLHAFRSLRPQ